MKRLIALAFAALCATQAQAAMSLKTMQGAYDSDAVAYFNALAGNSCAAPSVAFKAAISAYIKAERAAGNWDSQDAEYIFATTDSCTASINLAQPSLYKITWSGSPPFTVQNGLPSDGATQYGDTNVQQINLIRLTQNNARIGVWVNASNKNNVLGLLALGTKFKLGAVTNKVTILNSASGVTDTGGGTAGLHFAWRTSSSAITTGLNGVVQSNAVANTSATLGAQDVTICNSNGGFCTINSNLLFVGFGAPLTSESMHYTNVRNLLLALGVTGI